jgi:AmpD protein
MAASSDKFDQAGGTARCESGADFADGWYALATPCPSPNFGPRPAAQAITLALIHSISLPPGQYGGDAIERLFTNRLDWEAHPYFQSIRGLQVSAHFLVRRDGTVLQFVSCDQRAWHAGQSCFQGRPNCNDYSIGIELEGLEGETFEAPQYASLTALLKSLAKSYPIEHVAGHEHVAPERKQDPGAGFDWARLERELGWNARCFP